MNRAKSDLSSNDLRRLDRAETWLLLGKPRKAARSLHTLKARGWTKRAEHMIWQVAQAVQDNEGLGKGFPRINARSEALP
jgi:hypothetical protein